MYIIIVSSIIHSCDSVYSNNISFLNTFIFFPALITTFVCFVTVEITNSTPNYPI